MTDNGMTHYRKAFDSPYLSSADIVGPTPLTIKKVTFEADRTKKTKESFNTAWFAEKELRPGEKLKPMILNATNSKMIAKLTGVFVLSGWHGFLAAQRKKIAAGTSKYSGKFWRMTNEVPFVLAIVMVLSVTTEWTFR